MVNADSKQVQEALEWIRKVSEYVKSYKPETKSMSINYRTQDAEIEILLHIPDNIRRKIRKVEIPAYQNFEISEMRDESFNRIGSLWWFEDGKWKLDPSKLPSSEKYLLTLKGRIPADALTRIVFVQPAANRDRTEEMDRYWLASMIRNVEILEKLYDALNIDDVVAGVKIGIERCFSTSIPQELNKRLRVIRRWIHAGHGRDREEVMRTWRQLRSLRRTSKISVDEIIEAIYRLTSPEVFSRFLGVDEPYILGEIRREERFKGTFPERMYTEARTYLTLKRPAATGYLSFRKKDYTETIKKEFEKLS
jgi:hypothetical protein